jgi:peptidoglycan/LPS O-acetylase OafA/YrhL
VGAEEEEVAAMATTRDRLDELTRSGRDLDDRELLALEDAWVAPQARSRPAARTAQRSVAATGARLARRLEPITTRWAGVGAVAWVVLLAVGIAVEPPPTNPNAVDPWFVSALGTMLLGMLLLAFAGFWLRRRWSLAASLVAAGLLVLSTVMCPVSGHHTGVGAWWVIQLGCGLGLVAASTLGLQRTAPRSAR